MLNLAEMGIWLITGVLVISLLALVFVIGERSDITDAEMMADFRRLNKPQVGQQQMPTPPVVAGAQPTAAAAPGRPVPRPGARPAPRPGTSPGEQPEPRIEEPGRGFDERADDRGIVIGGPAGDGGGNVSYPETIVVPNSLVNRYSNFQDAYQLAHEAASELMPDGSLLVYDIQPGSVLESVVGLRSNDRIISVNGRPMPSDFSTSKSLYNELRNENNFQVEVVRGGQRMVLSFTRQGR